MTASPGRSEIVECHRALMSSAVLQTPVLDGSVFLPEFASSLKSLTIKLEVFQRTGSFKLRGSINFIRALTPEQLQYGVTAFSGGNHAIAVSYAAKAFGTTAKVVMPQAANPARVAACRDLGAEVHLVAARADAPALAMEFVRLENRTLIPPFDHPRIVEGTSTLGYEFVSQSPDLEVVIVPIGGGGLAAGVGCAIKAFLPNCRVIGVQPKGADAMFRSFQSGKPEFNETTSTVADSLCPPQVGAYTFPICRQVLDDVWLVDESEIKHAMRLFYDRLRLVVEGAGALSLAALLSTYRNDLHNRRVGVVVSGSNIDLPTFTASSELQKNCTAI